MTRLWRITHERRGICAGVAVDGGRVVEAAPILRAAGARPGLAWDHVRAELARQGFHGAPVVEAGALL